MNILQRIKCVFGHHERDRTRVRYCDDVFGSVCAGCGKRMVRRDRSWSVEQA
ncbi:hypothetical protein [Sphingomonas sp.]|uniref:hypothetical protein n=1 Tax=Sphingomonas sp. TaxID=28214 RepID=UPI003B3BB6DF